MRPRAARPPPPGVSLMRPFHAVRAPAIAALLLLVACGQGQAPSTEPAAADVADADAAPGEVNLYTTRESGLIKRLVAAFAASSGIQVSKVFVRDGLLEGVRAEGERAPADVLMTVDTGNLIDQVDNGQTQTVPSQELADAIPAHLRGADVQW